MFWKIHGKFKEFSQKILRKLQGKFKTNLVQIQDIFQDTFQGKFQDKFKTNFRTNFRTNSRTNFWGIFGNFQEISSKVQKLFRKILRKFGDLKIPFCCILFSLYCQKVRRRVLKCLKVRRWVTFHGEKVRGQFKPIFL